MIEASGRLRWRLRAYTTVVLALSSGADLAAGGWDITDTGEPADTVELSLTEGTWMSVDVSPDGQTLLFDLLGDIYRIAAVGGDATLVHSGPAMQRSPSFSPDGRRVLYISDASGMDNLWTSNPDGSGARQVTHETVDVLTSPAWGPLGETVSASKIESTVPRMHSSEIRLFDLDGGSAGRVLVETPKNKRDVQEAQYSPDGRYAYYTERLTDPAIFVDAHHINFAIKRRDLASGQTEELLSGFGSATTPQLSPDGRRIAFIRRVMAKTVLFVYDVETREQRAVYDGLDRDAQADFVQHGTYYPHFDWFPDNRHVVIWGKGKLLRIDMETGENAVIPFRATSRHRITAAVRVGRDIAPDRVDVRIVRQLASSPDGRTLLFTALGSLWSQSIPDGRPARLTRATAFESEPAFSSDGRRVAYVEWDDERGSTLKLASPAGKGARVIAVSPGVIRQPAFSRDGERVVYRIQAGDKSMGGYRARPGLYWVPVAGGDSRYVAPADDAPMFSPDGTRIYYVAIDYTGDSAVHRLESVNLDGLDKRVHALTPNADTLELRPSPDLHWIAFRERQQYYVVPYRETGVPLLVSAGTLEVPVVPLTDLGGYALTWSTDSSRLHWALGPQLYDVDVAARFASGATLPAPGASIDLQVPADVPNGTLAFINGRVITMEGDEVIERGTVVVVGNRIAAVGPSDDIAIPDGAKLIEVSGKTVMPGLIDMHGHIDCCYQAGSISQKQPARYAALAYGVTTNLDPYSNELTTYESEETRRAGITVSPRWFGSGSVIYGRAQKSDFTFVPIAGIDDARKALERKKALGAIYIKSYKQPARSQRQQLVKAAREAGILIDVEGESHFYNNITMILDGHTNLEHTLPLANYYDDVVQLFAHSRTSNTPTLIIAFAEIFGENYMYQTTRAWEEPKIRAYVQETNSWYSALNPGVSAPPYVRAMTTLHAADEIYDIGFRSVARSVKKLDDAGVVINAGSHGQIPGLAMHWEMVLLSQGGIDNHRVLRMATLNGARTLGIDDQLGSLKAGKLADLIVLDADPLADIKNTNSVRYTMVNGRLYDSLSMNEIGNYDRPRTKFYWEFADHHGIDWNEAWAEP